MANLPKITPHLWFHKEATEAAAFYCSLFPDSKLTHVSTIRSTPSGDCDIVSFELAGQPFKGIGAGPLFKFNPSVSFIVNFHPATDNNVRNNLDAAWETLSQGGTALMPLGEYPFSARYGWIQDRYGLSWQLMLSGPEKQEQPLIIPSLMFTGVVAGRAEEAFNFYVSVFKGAKIGSVHRYQAGQEPDKAGTVMFADFTLAGTCFAAMDSRQDHGFAFNEAISFLVPCDTQQEVDYYWERLSADPTAGRCGWLKDRFGLSWQVWPRAMGEMMGKGTPEQVARVTKAMLAMKKFDIAALEKAFKG